MKKYLIYLQRQEKLTIRVGIFLGVFLALSFGVNLKELSTIVYAQNVEDIESLVSETVELDTLDAKQDEEVKKDLIAPSVMVTDSIVFDNEAFENTVEERANVVAGAITLQEVEKPVSQQEEIIVAKGQTTEPVEILSASGVPNDEPGCISSKFTYMAYTAVTRKNSRQYKFLYSDACYSDPLTGIRMSGGRYCIALGTFYTKEIGQKVDLVLSNGEVLKCILGDCKADAHTDPTNRYHAVDGSVAEFIVDYDYFTSTSQWSTLNLTTIKEVQIVTE